MHQARLRVEPYLEHAATPSNAALPAAEIFDQQRRRSMCFGHAKFGKIQIMLRLLFKITFVRLCTKSLTMEMFVDVSSNISSVKTFIRG